MAAPDRAQVEVPIQLLDAGPGHVEAACSDREVAVRLRASMLAVRAAVGPEEVVLRLVDLVGALVATDAVTLELRGPLGHRVPWLLAHRGLRPDEVSRLTDAAWRTHGPDRLGERLAIELIGERARPGRLTMWRTTGGFTPVDVERAELAATSIETLLHQFLRRLKGRQRQRWSRSADRFTDAVGTTPAADQNGLQLVVEQVRAVAGCDVAWLVCGTAERPVLGAITGDGVAASDLHDADLRSALTLQVLASGEQLRITDLSRDVPPTDQAGLAFLDGIGPSLIQPVLLESRVAGALGLAWRADRSAGYLSLDPSLPTAFAARAALAIRIGRARDDAERLAVLEERNRIRLDLHDRVVQRLYALGMSLESARHPDSPVQIDRLLDHAVDLVDETITQIRRTLSGLSLAEEGIHLYDALVDLLDRVFAAATFRPELRVSGLGEVAVAPQLVDDLLSVVEEAVSNVVRHARATRCRITLAVDGALVLTVEDDGVGITPGTVGSGLANLRDRAAAHAGTLTVVDLAPGTRLTWSVPQPAAHPTDGPTAASTA